MDLHGCPCGGTPNIADDLPHRIACDTCHVFIDDKDAPSIWNRMVDRVGSLAACCKDPANWTWKIAPASVVVQCSTCRRRHVPFGHQPPAPADDGETVTVTAADVGNVADVVGG